MTARILAFLACASTAVTAFAVPKAGSAVSGDINAALSPYGVAFRGCDARVVKNVKRVSAPTTFHTVIAEKDALRIEIDVITPLEKKIAANYAEAKYSTIADLYGPQSTGYPGQVSNTSECPADRKPQRTSVVLLGQTVEVLTANVSKRFAFGVWEDDLIKNKAAFAVVYDEINHTLLQVKVFKPIGRSDPRDALLSVIKSIERLP